MNVIDAIRKRKSCRDYEGTKLTVLQEEALLCLAEHTPSAGSIRPLVFKAISDELTKMFLAKAAGRQAWIATASVVFVILDDYDKIAVKYHGRGRQYALLEAGHAAQNICLAATELGLGSCCVGAFRESAVLKALGLENSGLTPVYIVTVGKKKP